MAQTVNFLENPYSSQWFLVLVRGNLKHFPDTHNPFLSLMIYPLFYPSLGSIELSPIISNITKLCVNTAIVVGIVVSIVQSKSSS